MRTPTEDLLRDLAPQVLGGLVRRGTDFSDAEDAVQEASLEAATRWPRDGVPPSPAAWLRTVATRKVVDAARSDSARRRREGVAAAAPPPGPSEHGDDTLALLFLCCHPALSPSAAVPLTLRAVGGLTTREIATARALHRSHDDPEVAGLLALMLLHHARRRARTDEVGAVVPLSDQDRSRWDTTMITDGVAILTAALAQDQHGPYQVQAAIAALHDDAVTADETDWHQILAWYDALVDMTGNPLAGDRAGAAELFVTAADRAPSTPERNHLLRRAARART